MSVETLNMALLSNVFSCARLLFPKTVLSLLGRPPAKNDAWIQLKILILEASYDKNWKFYLSNQHDWSDTEVECKNPKWKENNTAQYWYKN